MSIAIANFKLQGAYGGSISRIAVQGGGSETEKVALGLDDVEALKKKDAWSADDITDVTNTLLFLASQQPLDGEKKAIYDGLIAMLIAKPAVMDKVSQKLAEQTSEDSTDDGVNEKTSAAVVLDAIAAAKGSSILGTGLVTETPTNTIVNSKYWDFITQKHLDDKTKARLSEILNMPAKSDIERQAKIKALGDYLRNTLGWTQGFIAVAMSSKYLLRDGIEKVTVDSFERFARNEIVAYYNTTVAPSHKAGDKKSPLYLYDEFTIIDASDPEMAETKEYLQSDAAKEKARAAGVDYAYDSTKSFAENFIAYTDKMGMSFVADTKAEFLLYGPDGKTSAEKALVKTLSAKKFLDSIRGTAVVKSGDEDAAAKKKKADLAIADTLAKITAIDPKLADALKVAKTPEELDALGLTALAVIVRDSKTTSDQLKALGLDTLAAAKKKEEDATVAAQRVLDLAAADTFDKVKALDDKDNTLVKGLAAATAPADLEKLGLTALAQKARDAKTSAELTAFGLTAMAANKKKEEDAALPKGITLPDPAVVAAQKKIEFQAKYATLKTPAELAAFLDEVAKSTELPQAEKDKYLGTGKGYVFQETKYSWTTTIDAQIYVQNGTIYLIQGQATKDGWYFTYDATKQYFSGLKKMTVLGATPSFTSTPAFAGSDSYAARFTGSAWKGANK
jgi:hypothetical protein